MDDKAYIVKTLLKLGVLLQKNGNRITSKYGLNQQQFVVLSEIVSRDRAYQKELVGELLLEKSNISKITKKLKSLGLVNVAYSEKDARATVVSTTDKGKALCESCLLELNQWSAASLVWMEKEEADLIAGMLKRLDVMLCKSP
jgi:DNA-binding MarR family transcriptional regulator